LETFVDVLQDLQRVFLQGSVEVSLRERFGSKPAVCEDPQPRCHCGSGIAGIVLLAQGRQKQRRWWQLVAYATQGGFVHRVAVAGG